MEGCCSQRRINAICITLPNELHYKSILENILTEKPELFHKVGNIDTKNYLLDALKNAVNLKQFNEEHLNVLLCSGYISDADYITNMDILGEANVALLHE